MGALGWRVAAGALDSRLRGQVAAGVGASVRHTGRCCVLVDAGLHGEGVEVKRSVAAVVLLLLRVRCALYIVILRAAAESASSPLDDDRALFPKRGFGAILLFAATDANSSYRLMLVTYGAMNDGDLRRSS